MSIPLLLADMYGIKEEIVSIDSEVWMPVVGYEGLYEISNLGRVHSVARFKARTKILSLNINAKYYAVGLRKNNKYKIHKVHRLVALAFIHNPDNLPQVNHKDENKLNNCVDNLEWCARQYNINYGSRNKKQAETLMKSSCNDKPVARIDSDGHILEVFHSGNAAGRKLGINSRSIRKVCYPNHYMQSTHNMSFKFLTREEFSEYVE